MTKTGLFAAAFGLASIAFVLVVAQGMRDSGFIIQAYTATAVIVAGYVWLLARRLARARSTAEARKS